MSFLKSIRIFLLTVLVASPVLAQELGGRATGGVKGKVSVESGSAADIKIVVRQGERDVTSASTDRKGAFSITGLAPGIYNLSFHKPGLSTGTLSKVEVRSGKTRELKDRLVLTVDDGSLAFLRGSVFDPMGRSVSGARIELARVAPDGTARKIDGRLSTETGQFVFRLNPEAAKYRVTVKLPGAETVSKDVEVDGAAVYRIALSLKTAAK
jgi:carboxypeptidase family protein